MNCTTSSNLFWIKRSLCILFYSTFSLTEWKETEAQFDKRNLECLEKAADGGVIEAMYLLSSYYLVGDLADKDLVKGEKYLSDAVIFGYGPAACHTGYIYFTALMGSLKIQTKR